MFLNPWTMSDHVAHFKASRSITRATRYQLLRRLERFPTHGLITSDKPTAYYFRPSPTLVSTFTKFWEDLLPACPETLSWGVLK